MNDSHNPAIGSPTGRLTASEPEIQHLPGSPMYGKWKGSMSSKLPSYQQIAKDPTQRPPELPNLDFTAVEKRIILRQHHG